MRFKESPEGLKVGLRVKSLTKVLGKSPQVIYGAIKSGKLKATRWMVPWLIWEDAAREYVLAAAGDAEMALLEVEISERRAEQAAMMAEYEERRGVKGYAG